MIAFSLRSNQISRFRVQADSTHTLLPSANAVLDEIADPDCLIATPSIHAPSTSLCILRLFVCTEFADGKEYLEADLSIECNTPRHDHQLLYSWLMILICKWPTPPRGQH